MSYGKSSTTKTVSIHLFWYLIMFFYVLKFQFESLIGHISGAVCMCLYVTGCRRAVLSLHLLRLLISHLIDR